MKRPDRSIREVSPTVSSTIATPSTCPSPNISLTVVFQRTSILGLDSTRSCSTRSPVSASPLWNSMTLLAYSVRTSASSSAESPPPTTPTVWFMKNPPSQVAQYETPAPYSSSSPATPSFRRVEPPATITALAAYSVPHAEMCQISPSCVSSSTSPSCISRPYFIACCCMRGPISAPEMPSGKPGKFSMLSALMT